MEVVGAEEAGEGWGWDLGMKDRNGIGVCMYANLLFHGLGPGSRPFAYSVDRAVLELYSYLYLLYEPFQLPREARRAGMLFFARTSSSRKTKGRTRQD